MPNQNLSELKSRQYLNKAEETELVESLNKITARNKKDIQA
jgi:hypothetical protein